MRLLRTDGPGPVATVRIVGVRPDLFNNGTSRYVTVSPAFYRAYGAREFDLAAPRNAIKVRLRNGSADLPAFQRATERIAGEREFQFTVEDQEAAKLQSGFHLQAQALWVAAGLGAAAVLLLLAQGIARTIELESRRHQTLLVLGMTQAQLAGLVLGRTLLIAGTAAVVSVPVGIALSPLAPFGRAGGLRAEPRHRGRRGRARRRSRGRPVRGARRRCGRGGSRAGDARGRRARGCTDAQQHSGRCAGAGRRAADARRRRAHGDPRSALRHRRHARATLVGAVLAVAVAAAALTVAASLSHLLGTPRLFGQTWDFANIQGHETAEEEIASARADPTISAAAFGTEATLVVGGRTVGVAAYDPIKRTARPHDALREGPDPRRRGAARYEDVRRLGVGLGDRVAVRRGARTVRMTVVGRGILPETSFLALGEGAAMTFAGLKRVVPGAFASRLLFRVTEGADREATLRRLEAFYETPRAGAPMVVRDVRAVRRVPIALAAAIALLAAATLARTLVLSIRRRRRELAVLKTLGFTRGQVRATIAWHATTVGAIALVAGLPLGFGVGRWIWNVVAEHLGVAPAPVTPGGSLLLVVPAVLLLANVVAALPGGLAARTKPAVVLRAE